MSKLLLVEPDRMLAKVYADYLEANDHQVSPVAGAQSAIHAADQRQPDLIILELQLVEHSGIEFLYELRSYPEWQAIPVIVQTVVQPREFSGNWQLLKQELGVTSYLYKPQTKLGQLLEAITQELNVPA